jgi:hypothetical protein
MKIFPLHTQRALILTASLLGALSLYLPWIKISLFGFSKLENGLHGIGILVFSLFVVTGLLTLVGDKKLPMDPLIKGINQVASSGALVGIIIFFYKASSSVMEISQVQFGLYLGAAAALSALFCSIYTGGHKGPIQ